METQILKGAPVAAALNETMKADTAALKEKGIVPTLAVLRVGARADDLSYERGAMKRAAAVGIEVRNVVLPEDVDSGTFFAALEADHAAPERRVAPIVDGAAVLGCTDGSLAGVFTNTPLGFAPCTAQAAMEILHYYGIPVSGLRAAVIGRSLVIGRPVAMMLMHENATVTVCHTRTKDVPAVTREADLVIAASGQMESVGREYLREGQIVIDVGIGWNEEKQKLCGDVRFEEAEGLVSALTPVPGGVGSVTTAVLCRHVVDAAMKCG